MAFYRGCQKHTLSISRFIAGIEDDDKFAEAAAHCASAVLSSPDNIRQLDHETARRALVQINAFKGVSVTFEVKGRSATAWIVTPTAAHLLGNLLDFDGEDDQHDWRWDSPRPNLRAEDIQDF